MPPSPVPIPPRPLRRMLPASLVFGALLAGTAGLFAPSLHAGETPAGNQQAEAATDAAGMAIVVKVAIFVLACFVGYEVITKIPPLLHTPLMSGSNAISGITLVGSLVAAASGFATLLSVDGLISVLGFLAVAFATINVVGGFLVTDRMLGMFKRKD